jgi:hypothetical protein
MPMPKYTVYVAGEVVSAKGATWLVPVARSDTWQWVAFVPGGIVSGGHEDVSLPNPAVLYNWPSEEDYNAAV